MKPAKRKWAMITAAALLLIMFFLYGPVKRGVLYYRIVRTDFKQSLHLVPEQLASCPDVVGEELLLANLSLRLNTDDIRSIRYIESNGGKDAGVQLTLENMTVFVSEPVLVVNSREKYLKGSDDPTGDELKYLSFEWRKGCAIAQPHGLAKVLWMSGKEYEQYIEQLNLKLLLYRTSDELLLFDCESSKAILACMYPSDRRFIQFGWFTSDFVFSGISWYFSGIVFSKNEEYAHLISCFVHPDLDMSLAKGAVGQFLSGMGFDLIREVRSKDWRSYAALDVERILTLMGCVN